MKIFNGAMYIGVTDLRSTFGKRLEALEKGEVEGIVMMRSNKPVAVILTVKEYDLLKEGAV